MLVVQPCHRQNQDFGISPVINEASCHLPRRSEVDHLACAGLHPHSHRALQSWCNSHAAPVPLLQEKAQLNVYALLSRKASAID